MLPTRTRIPSAAKSTNARSYFQQSFHNDWISSDRHFSGPYSSWDPGHKIKWSGFYALPKGAGLLILPVNCFIASYFTWHEHGEETEAETKTGWTPANYWWIWKISDNVWYCIMYLTGSRDYAYIFTILFATQSSMEMCHQQFHLHPKWHIFTGKHII